MDRKDNRGQSRNYKVQRLARLMRCYGCSNAVELCLASKQAVLLG